MNINAYRAHAQYQQLMHDLLQEERFYMFNDISLAGDSTSEFFPYGIVFFQEINSKLYATYILLRENIERYADDHVVMIQIEVETGYKSVIYSACAHDLDDMFTKMLDMENRVKILMVNETCDSITYKFPNLVTFISDVGILHDKLLNDCNYAIVRD